MFYLSHKHTWTRTPSGGGAEGMPPPVSKLAAPPHCLALYHAEARRGPSAVQWKTLSILNRLQFQTGRHRLATSCEFTSTSSFIWPFGVPTPHPPITIVFCLPFTPAVLRVPPSHCVIDYLTLPCDILTIFIVTLFIVTLFIADSNAFYLFLFFFIFICATITCFW